MRPSFPPMFDIRPGDEVVVIGANAILPVGIMAVVREVGVNEGEDVYLDVPSDPATWPVLMSPVFLCVTRMYHAGFDPTYTPPQGRADGHGHGPEPVK